MGRPVSSAAENCTAVATSTLGSATKAYAARYAAGRKGPTRSGFAPGP